MLSKPVMKKKPVDLDPSTPHEAEMGLKEATHADMRKMRFPRRRLGDHR